jgi:hypothetical protein
MLNLRDQDRHSTVSPEKLALSQGSINFLLYCLPHFPLLREASPRSLTQVLSGCLAPAQQTTSAVNDDNHRRPQTKPRPFLDESSPHHGHKGPELHRGSTWNRPPPNTRVTTLPLFVTCSGHPSWCWPCSPMLNLRDQERHSTASPERGSISSLLYCPPHYDFAAILHPFIKYKFYAPQVSGWGNKISCHNKLFSKLSIWDYLILYFIDMIRW